MSGRSSFDVGSVVRGGFWLYGVSVVGNVSGFLYWLIISRIAGSWVLGVASTVVGFSGLITGLVSFGVPLGLQRFLGREARYGRDGLALYFWSSMLFMMLVYGATSLAIYVASTVVDEFFGIDYMMMRFSSLLVLLGCAGLFTSYLVSILKTNILFYASLVGNILKIIVGVILVLLGFGWTGVVVGYMCVGIANTLFGFYYVVKTIGLKPYFKHSIVSEVLLAGVAGWLPGIIVLAGQWIGVLVVFGSSGAVETGHYYVALVLSGFIVMIGSSMLNLLLPVLSGLQDNRKRVSYEVLRLGTAIVTPLVFTLMLYPWVPLSLLGREYVSASTTLTVLLASAFPMFLSQAVSSLVYAYGWYREVLLIGLTQNIPRLILYFMLTPVHGGLGAAIAYTLGSYVGLAYVYHIVRRIKYPIDKRGLCLTIGIPATVTLLAYTLKLHWVAGSLAILSSYLLYLRLGVLTKRDLRILLNAFISREKIDSIYHRLKPLVDFITPA